MEMFFKKGTFNIRKFNKIKNFSHSIGNIIVLSCMLWTRVIQKPIKRILWKFYQQTRHREKKSLIVNSDSFNKRAIDYLLNGTILNASKAHDLECGSSNYSREKERLNLLMLITIQWINLNWIIGLLCSLFSLIDI